MKVNYKSFGKLNIFLKVIEYCKDLKMHKLSMINTEINLYDEIVLDITYPGDGYITIDMKPDYKVALRDNLIYKASKLYMERSNFFFDANFKVKKNIPLGSGLGGGSSNASYTLLTLNKIFNKLNLEEIINIAFSLGSDLPFFIKGGLCRVESFGEVVEMISINKYDELIFLVIIPSFSLSTKEVYEKFDEISNNIMQDKSPPSILGLPLHNDLIYATEQIEPRIKEVILDLKILNPIAFSMTGSGSGCFAVFDNYNETKVLYKKIRKKYDKTFLVKPKLERNI